MNCLCDLLASVCVHDRMRVN